MASQYITIVTQNPRSNALISLATDTLSVSQRLAQTKAEMDSIMGNPVVYLNLVNKYGLSTEAEATALYAMVVAAKTAIDVAGITSFTKNVGL
jgi:hypothetical protein